MEWISSSLVYLWDQLTVTTVWNTEETGDIYAHIMDDYFNMTDKVLVGTLNLDENLQFLSEINLVFMI